MKSKKTPSEETIEYVKSLERYIGEHEGTVHLFATNFKVNLYNHDKLKSLPGQVNIFHSKDEGDSYYLQKFQAPKILGLKIGCHVMIVVNLSSKLVNSTTSIVKNILDDVVIVHFMKPDQTLKIERYLLSLGGLCQKDYSFRLFYVSALPFIDPKE